MKKWLWLFFVLITSNCFAETVGVPSKEALLKAFQEALNAKNEEAIMNLIYWQGVQEKICNILPVVGILRIFGTGLYDHL